MSSQEDNQNEGCKKALELAVTSNKTIQKMIESIENLGCKLPENFFACRPCDENISGGLLTNSAKAKDYKPQVILCQNRWLESETFENTIIHELVHAYDACRVKAFDASKCLEHACTEIRASAMSGECGLLHEMARGNIALTNGHNACVKRRATISVSANPACQVILLIYPS